jgi:hypothetical protein
MNRLSDKQTTQTPAPVLGVAYDTNNHQFGLQYDANGETRGETRDSNQ